MTLVHRPQIRSLTIEPPIALCSADHQRKEWLAKKQQQRFADFTRLAIAGVLLSIVTIKPLNTTVEWGLKLLGLPNFDTPSLETNFKIDSKDKSFNDTFKLGDKVLEWEVTSVFGKREAPCPSCSSDHKGVDINTPIGTPVYAIGKANSSSAFMDGYVDVACPFNPLNPPEGIAAYIQSPLLPEYEIALFHLNECYSGRHPVGAMIAKSGNTGASTGAHLHFGLKYKGEWIDPPKGFVLWALQGKEPQATTSKPIIEKLRNAIAGQESNHDSSAVNPHSNALGYGQIMPENIKEWSTQCLGMPLTEDEFIKSKDKQFKIIDCKLTEYLKETAISSANEDEQVRKVASMWYSGRADLYNDSTPQKYGTGSYPSVLDYGNQVLKRVKTQ